MKKIAFKSTIVGILTLITGLLLSCAASEDPQGKLRAVTSVSFKGAIKGPEDISGIANVGPFLVIGSDEGAGPNENENQIQALKKTSKNHYEVQSDIHLFDGNKKEGKEMDIEGIATMGEWVYVVGSHSFKRKRIKEDRKYKGNLKTFHADKIEQEKNRDWLYRLKVNAQGKASEKQRVTLRRLISEDSVLKLFHNIPSKENGVDIEGVAATEEWLYLGLRGPVLRNNYVPVIRLKFDNPKSTYELLYVNLGGRGIRDITRVSDGFLIIAGPPGDGPASYQLYHWDGRDTVPGKDRASEDIGVTSLLGEITPPPDGKAEGIVVLKEQPKRYEIIIVYDGIDRGGAQRFDVARP
jgi:hypothetical protein